MKYTVYSVTCVAQEFARRIAKVSIDCNMQLDEDEYVAKFKCTLMDIVLAWCKGATFLDICKMTDVFEGSIIRCIRRLEEVLRQLCQAAKSIGNTDLEEKFSSAITMLKRDIIFAAKQSLPIVTEDSTATIKICRAYVICSRKSKRLGRT
ncbi:hypothetical protein RR48_00516 [Papilio machaon]|uniref:ATP-dependent RNA helicase Ski2/MTR4 C-terminal domain-containing protein n=1 Tax=Papilio machaon TaxID=76193 RepID=A0A0N1PJW5_PAPMA|nr:hypothetical protein RR48_00516 [Papilio machaon]